MPVYQLSDTCAFPPPRLAEPDGLLAVGGDLSSERLLAAYQQGIFPWFNEGDPILWWSPDPRMVLFPDELRISKSLRRVVRQDRFAVSADRAFERVMTACAETRRGDGEDTWISPEMIGAYSELHVAGYAHSVECRVDDELVGGLYGIALGRVFFGESMFSRATDASKVALVALVAQLRRWNYELIDCQIANPHLSSLGAREIPRDDFLSRVRKGLETPATAAPWTLDEGVAAELV